MTFQETSLPGAFLITPERKEDERGFYARTFCRDEFAAYGLDPELTQAGLSFNRRAGTLRGLHYQADPFGQTKLVRCSQGAIFDVIVDLRPESKTCGKWFGCELTAADQTMLFVPVGFAHGFQTLVDATEVCYHMGSNYVPEADRGLRWDDPALGIRWPECSHRTLSPRDASYPDWSIGEPR